VYHVELRQFPHNLNRFNLEARELGPIVAPWVREKVVDLGERTWSPHQARLRILEGPRLAVEDLSMGRGWRTAQRESEDVTERILAEAKAAMDAAAAAAPPAPAPVAPPAPAAPQSGATPVPARSAAPAGDASMLSDPLALGVVLASLLGSDPAGLLSAWREIAARAPGLSPSESLALAEREIGSSGSSPDSSHGR
jgi:hypothetical protein